MEIFISIMLSSIANYFLGYYSGVRFTKKNFLNPPVEPTVTVDEPVTEEVEKKSDLSFDNFKATKEEGYYSDFTIEHYPESRKFYPRYKNFYLKKEYSTGIVKTVDEMRWGQASISEISALRIIELFKEQKFKKNVTTIKVKK